ncbi:MAG: UMP kinase [Alkalispirochaeta sp.]
MVVISLGGSIVVPDEPDSALIRAYRSVIGEYVEGRDARAILVVGGGAPARRYQNAFREAGGDAADADAQDWIGIMATRLNAELMRHALAPYCVDPVVYNPTGEIAFNGSVLVAAGWKPGFSTDYDAVLLAERYGADTVINLSNVARVYTADPKVDPDARPLDRISWSEFRELVGDEWTPGKNLPFDPVATRRAAELRLRVIAADGKEIENTRKILNGDDYFGTTIGPE